MIPRHEPNTLMLSLAEAEDLAKELALPPGEAERQECADEERPHDRERRRAGDRRHHPEEEGRAEDDVRELGGAQRRLAAFEHLLDALPLAQVTECALGRAQHQGKRGEPLLA